MVRRKSFRMGILTRIAVYFDYIKNSLRYFFLFLTLMFITLFLSGTSLSIENIALFLTLNKEPANPLEGLALILIFFLELSPLMAFIELRTLNKLDKLEIMASKLSDHIIVVGCGHLGSRIVDRLTYIGLPFVTVVLPSDVENNEKVMQLIEMNMPIVLGDASLEITLKKAGVERAKAIIIAINNDMLNSKIAEKAKKVNPEIKTVVRIYSDDFAEILEKSGFADEIISTTAIAVDKYILGAFVDIIRFESEPISLKVTSDLPICNKKIGEVEMDYGVKVLAIKRRDEWLRNDLNEVINEGDEIVIYGPPKSLKNILEKLMKI